MANGKKNALSLCVSRKGAAQKTLGALLAAVDKADAASAKGAATVSIPVPVDMARTILDKLIQDVSADRDKWDALLSAVHDVGPSLEWSLDSAGEPIVTGIDS